MAQEDLISSTRLRISDSVRRSAAQPGRVLLRAAGGERRLVLTPTQAAILTDGFASPASVPEVLARQLTAQGCPPLSDFYELVLQAHAARVLVEADEPPEQSLARRWPFRVPVKMAGVIGNVIVVLSTVALVLAPWSAPAGWADWLGGWLVACALLSAGQALAAGALAGGGCEVRARRISSKSVLPHFGSDASWAFRRFSASVSWKSLLPHFSIDTAEAVMGGRACELTVAVLRTVPVFVGAALIAWQLPGWLAPVLAALFYSLAPWGGTAATQWLGASHGAPQFSVRSGFIFEFRSRDAWTRWRKRWEGLRKRSLVHWAAWIVLVALAGGRCLPDVAAPLLAWFGTAGGLNPFLRGTIYSLTAGVVVAVVALAKALFEHWWLARGLSKPLRDDAARKVMAPALQGDTRSVLRQVALFKSLGNDDMAALAEAMQPVEVEKKRVVFHEDEAGDAFYVVVEGELEILKRGTEPPNRMETIGWLGPGDGFGETALLEGTVRTATVRASQASRLLRLAKADFDRLVVGRIGAERVREVLQYAVFLGRLVFLAGWPFEDLLRYAARCGSVRFNPGVQVLRRGDPNIWFYLVYDGSFEALDGDRVLRRIQPGDYFGEISLLENGIATATVVALEESRCLTMGRTEFHEFFAKDYRIGLRMEALAVKRLGSRLFVSR